MIARQYARLLIRTRKCTGAWNSCVRFKTFGAPKSIQCLLLAKNRNNEPRSRCWKIHKFEAPKKHQNCVEKNEPLDKQLPESSIAMLRKKAI